MRIIYDPIIELQQLKMAYKKRKPVSVQCKWPEGCTKTFLRRGSRKYCVDHTWMYISGHQARSRGERSHYYGKPK